MRKLRVVNYGKLHRYRNRPRGARGQNWEIILRGFSVKDGGLRYFFCWSVLRKGIFKFRKERV